ncbi:circadian clock protein KaiB, partial [Kouleothrix aurantiaca]
MKYRLRLFVTGYTSHSRRAIENLRQICERDLIAMYEAEVINILEHPQIAEN